MGHCFSHFLKHLRAVNIYGFMGGGGSDDIEAGSKGVDRFLGSHHRQLQFVNILLRNSKLLEKVKIILTDKYSFTRWCEKPQLILKLKEKFLVFPKASPNAEICLMEG